MDQFSKDGRKLRPRKKVSTNQESPATSAFRTGEHSHFSDGSRRSYGDGKSYEQRHSSFDRHEGNRHDGDHRHSFSDARPAYGDRKPFGQRRSFGDGAPRRNFGEGSERRSFGPRRNFGEGKPYEQRHSSFDRREGESHEGEHRHSFSEARPAYGDRKPFGQRRSFGEGTSRRSFGEGTTRRSFGEGAQRRSFGEGSERRSFGPRRSFGEGKPYEQRHSSFDRREGGHSRNSFNKESNEGIQRMIDNSPRPMPKYFNNDEVSTSIKDEIRLNKFIANSGVCSRREADTMILAGVVTVNGEVVTELGTKVNVFNDVIKFNGETLKGESKVYLIMNKPRGYVTTASDPHAEKTVMDLLKACSARVYPVGRLDKATTGVLMFTNDGEIAERLTHPSYDKKKIYQVILNKPLDEESRQALLRGVELSDGTMNADSLEYIEPSDKRKLGIEIHSGKNRVVRRLFEAVGYEVRTLDRVYFAGLTKKGLKKGEWRFLTESEVNILKMGAYV